MHECLVGGRVYGVVHLLDSSASLAVRGGVEPGTRQFEGPVVLAAVGAVDKFAIVVLPAAWCGMRVGVGGGGG